MIKAAMPASFLRMAVLLFNISVIRDDLHRDTGSRGNLPKFHGAVLRLGPGEEITCSERCASVSVFGIRGQSMRTGNLFTSFSSLSTL